MNPDKYQKSQTLSMRDSEQIMSEYMGSMTWKPGERVLDIGCGPGSITAEILLPRLPEDIEVLVGADKSSDMLQLASSKYSHPKLEFLQLDLSKEIPADSKLRILGFDKIFSFYCIHWIYDQRLAISNIYNLLRPGGEALVTIIARTSIIAAYIAQSKKTEWQSYVKDVEQTVAPYHHSEDPAEDFKIILKDVGFQIVDCKWKELSFDFVTTSRMKEFVYGINPFISRMPKELRDIYITDLLMEITKVESKRSDNKDNKITEVYHDIIIAYFRKV
ncbi:juvenile hormone acid O-methyltransferase-like [Periplaneta americana]|uniref:juvenile hormone acid O-methyltransferase-like n=1 Tax=Periplaneta americana TaxID=6978 RepID=UPI0037E7E508